VHCLQRNLDAIASLELATASGAQLRVLAHADGVERRRGLGQEILDAREALGVMVTVPVGELSLRVHKMVPGGEKDL